MSAIKHPLPNGSIVQLASASGPVVIVVTEASSQEGSLTSPGYLVHDPNAPASTYTTRLFVWREMIFRVLV